MSNNPRGSNQYGSKNYPPDEILRTRLLHYESVHQDGATQLWSLEREFGLSIGLTKLKQLKSRLKIPTVRKLTRTRSLDDMVQDILDVAGLGEGGHRPPPGRNYVSRGQGVSAIRHNLSEIGIVIPEALIRQTLQIYDRTGLAMRYPGSGKSLQGPYSQSPGVNFEHSADGHEKLEMKALRMGGCSIPIYMVVDKFTSFIILMVAVPDCRDQNEVAHVFLDSLLATGGMAVQQTFDCGSEVALAAEAQTVLRLTFAPNLDLESFPAVRNVRSTHNTLSEAKWSFNRRKVGLDLRYWIESGSQAINTASEHDKHLFHWIWYPVVQRALDEFVRYWNHHRIRNQAIKRMPSGHRPEVMFGDPAGCNKKQFLIPVPADAVAAYRAQKLTRRQRWFPDEFGRVAQLAYDKLGSPEVRPSTAWSVFDAVRNELRRDVYAYVE